MTDIQDEMILERLELVTIKIKNIQDGECKTKSQVFQDYFETSAKLILDSLSYGANVTTFSLEKLKEKNRSLYQDLLAEQYGQSYANPTYASDTLGIYSKCLSFIQAELRTLPILICMERKYEALLLMELFVETYCLFEMDEKPLLKEVEDAIYYYAFDYVEDLSFLRLEEFLIPESGKAYHIIMDSNLEDFSYLYSYGDYISDTELRLARFLNQQSDDYIDRMARTTVGGFRRGFDTMRIDYTKKKTVSIRYHIGQERIVRRVIELFKEMGLSTIINFYPLSRVLRRGVVRKGAESSHVNRQFEYDHRMDDALFLDARFMDRRVNAVKSALEELSEEAAVYAGPAVIETFGEALFSPTSSEDIVEYTKEQEKQSVELQTRLGMTMEEFMPDDEICFTIIAFPVPDIGPDFEAIFTETMELNTLDNDEYTKIQQRIIDCLDQADHVYVKGRNGNRTDLVVKLWDDFDRDKASGFENCVADVNIPVGEVFTSPVLKGTEGLLHVTGVYLNGYFFQDLSLSFYDGVIKDYECHNDESDGKAFIKSNILFNHDFLPMGEFAIGTNTRAARMAEKFGIQAKMPILIGEKTGPHFAVGDTCYSHAEDKAVFNPDGKEIICRENDYSRLRDTDPASAYFNCHTDITIPYEELGELSAVKKDGTVMPIIKNGRFVLEGTEVLNEFLD